MSRALPAVIALAMAVFALIDCLQTDAALVRGPRRGVWLVAIVLLPVLGPLGWLVAGRPRRSAPPRRRPDRDKPVVPPDDDPTFLAQMREIDAEHEKLLKTWESDLRRREEDLRRRDRPDEPGDQP